MRRRAYSKLRQRLSKNVPFDIENATAGLWIRFMTHHKWQHHNARHSLVEALRMCLLFCKEVCTCPCAVLAHVYKYNVVAAHLHSWWGDLEFLLRK